MQRKHGALIFRALSVVQFPVGGGFAQILLVLVTAAAAAQRLVYRKFICYSCRNLWDTPAQAFRRGMGYCTQYNAPVAAIINRGGPGNPRLSPRRLPLTRLAGSWHGIIELTSHREDRTMDFPTLITFLSDLALHNDKPWFEAHRATYEHLRGEWLAFVGASGSARRPATWAMCCGMGCSVQNGKTLSSTA